MAHTRESKWWQNQNPRAKVGKGQPGTKVFQAEEPKYDVQSLSRRWKQKSEQRATESHQHSHWPKEAEIEQVSQGQDDTAQ